MSTSSRLAGTLVAAVLLSPFALTGVALAEDATPAPSAAAEELQTSEQSVAVAEETPTEEAVTTSDASLATQSGSNQACPGHAYCPTSPQPGDENQGNGNAPANGSVGNADSKNPPGQAPNGTDSNKGYECDQNKGIGDKGGNPAHTGCATTVIPVEGNGLAGLALAALSVPALGVALFVARRRRSSGLAA